MSEGTAGTGMNSLVEEGEGEGAPCTGLPGTAGTACREGTTGGREGGGGGVRGGGGGGAGAEGTGRRRGKSGVEGGGGGGGALVVVGGGRLVVGRGVLLVVVEGLLVAVGRGRLVVGGGGGLLVGGGGGLLVVGGGVGLLVEGEGLLAPAGLELGLATFCSTSPWMVLTLVPRATAGRPWPPWPLRPRNLSSSGVAGPFRGPWNWGAFRGPCRVYP